MRFLTCFDAFHKGNAILILVVLLVCLALVACPVLGQARVELGPGQGFHVGLDSDSGDFHHVYDFDVPDGVRADSLVIYFWQNSADGNVDVDIYAKFGMSYDYDPGIFRGSRKYYKWRVDSQLVVTADTTEGITFWELMAAAGDTTNNGNTVQPDAVQIVVVGGGSNNRADNEYLVKVFGIKDDDM